MSSPGPDHRDRFRALYTSHFEALLAYAVRRVERPEDAGDVVADTFLVAWRRRSAVPAGEDARLWLYGVARHVLANQRRGDRRRDRLGEALRVRLAASSHLRVDPDHATEVTAGLAVREALARLGALDREVLMLTAWEELEPREIADVLGVSAQAVRTRLSRARARLRELIGDEADLARHVTRATSRSRLALEEGS